MNWAEAKKSTLEAWRRIRASLDTADDLELLEEINAICDLCDVAKEEAPAGDPRRCPSCLAHEQFGGCRQASLEMSECVVAGERSELKVLVDDFVGRLESIEVPPER